jgi:hypothetical protein
VLDYLVSKKKPPEEEPKLVYVEWEDAYTQEAGWKSIKKLRKQKPVLVKSVGYLVKDDPNFIIVAGTYVPEDGDCDGDTTIPRGMIRKVINIASPV